MASIPNNQQNYGIGRPYVLNTPAPVVAKRAPTVNDFNYAIGTIWVYPATSSAYILVSVASNQATWSLLESSGGGGSFSSLTVTPGPVSLTGTTNINTSGAAATNIGVGGTGAVTIGNVTGGTTIPAGGLTLTTGSINVSAGSVTAGLNLVASGGNITATAGNIVATAGDITATLGTVEGLGVYATGDAGGIALSTGLSNVVATAAGGGTVTFAANGAGDIVQTGWMKMYVGATAVYVPYFSSIA